MPAVHWAAVCASGCEDTILEGTWVMVVALSLYLCLREKSPIVPTPGGDAVLGRVRANGSPSLSLPH